LFTQIEYEVSRSDIFQKAKENNLPFCCMRKHQNNSTISQLPFLSLAWYYTIWQKTLKLCLPKSAQSVGCRNPKPREVATSLTSHTQSKAISLHFIFQIPSTSCSISSVPSKSSGNL